MRTPPFDKIKIDQSFILDLLEDARSDLIVDAIAGRGESLEMPIAAEGTDSERRMERVIARGRTKMRGSFHLRAVPSGDGVALISGVNGKSKNSFTSLSVAQSRFSEVRVRRLCAASANQPNGDHERESR